jgi:cobalt/nickel transport system ATP-binding protein
MQMTGDTLLDVRDLSYHYPNGAQALESITFQVKVQDRLALIGPNGAGKSTLILLLNGILRGSGTIHLLNSRGENEQQELLHKRIGVVFQNPDDQLFCPTLYDDVAFGPLNLGLAREEIDHRVRTALAQVDLQGFEDKSTLNMSFGERKIASLATILAMRPEIYIFDEPSSNLDPYHRRKIIEHIQGLTETLLIATHDLDLVLETCTRILILNKGRIVAGGGLELLADEPLLKRNNLELPYRYQFSRGNNSK